MPDATVKEIQAFFNVSAGTLIKEWKQLSDTDKAQIKAGIGNGSYTY
jgi:hypothetical protein